MSRCRRQVGQRRDRVQRDQPVDDRSSSRQVLRRDAVDARARLRHDVRRGHFHVRCGARALDDLRVEVFAQETVEEGNAQKAQADEQTGCQAGEDDEPVRAVELRRLRALVAGVGRFAQAELVPVDQKVVDVNAPAVKARLVRNARNVQVGDLHG